MRRILISAILFILVLTGVVLSQAPQPIPNLAPAGDVVIGSGSFSPIVADLERSLKFYSDLVGTAPPETIPAWSTDPALLNFLGAPTSQIRFGTVRIPGSAMTVELVEFKDIDRRPVRPKVSDPGAVRLILIVRNIDSLLDRLVSQGVPVLTTGKTPVALRTPEAGRAVLIQDPDGFFIELLQPNILPASNAPATSNVVGARFGLTFNSTNQTWRVYRDLLGFQPQISADFSSDKALTDLMAAPGAQIRRSTAAVPGSALLVEFLEFRGIERKPLGARIQDPGATRLQLRVRDSDATVKTLAAAGGTVITTGGDGGTILMSGLRVAIVREPNNLFLVILTAAPARGAR